MYLLKSLDNILSMSPAKCQARTCQCALASWQIEKKHIRSQAASSLSGLLASKVSKYVALGALDWMFIRWCWAELEWTLVKWDSTCRQKRLTLTVVKKKKASNGTDMTQTTDRLTHFSSGVWHMVSEADICDAAGNCQPQERFLFASFNYRTACKIPVAAQVPKYLH